MPFQNSRREAAFFMPGREFWTIWARVLVLIVLACLFLAPRAHATTMRASFYGAESGRVTASGAGFNPLGLSAAHRSLPFGTRLSVCFRGCATVVVNDRGPAAWTGRSLDLSHGAARAIGLEAAGVANVDVAIVGQGALPRAGRRARLSRRAFRHHRRYRR